MEIVYAKEVQHHGKENYVSRDNFQMQGSAIVATLSNFIIFQGDKIVLEISKNDLLVVREEI